MEGTSTRVGMTVDPEPYLNALVIAASFAVGLPILRKSRAARDRPAMLLAAALLIDGLEWVLWSFYLYWPESESWISDASAVACRVGIDAAVVCLGLFTWKTFHREDRLAAIAFWLALGALLSGFLGSGVLGDWRGFRADHPWIWLEVIAQISVAAWVGAAPALYYRRLRKRIAIGLADPVVANKFALWAIYGASYCAVQILFAVALAWQQDYLTLDPISIALTLAGTGALWLAFFPPGPYQAWLRGGAAQR